MSGEILVGWDEALEGAALPAQFYNKTYANEPERELLVAIFHDALNCVMSKRPHDRWRDEAISWFLDRRVDDSTRFTFHFICEELNYEPSKWQQWVREQMRGASGLHQNLKTVLKRHRPRGPGARFKVA